MKKTIHILTLSILVSCNLYERKKEVFITDQDYVENYREFSSDSSKLLINYSIDLGAFGYGQAGTAILNLEDTTKNIRKYTIPNTLTKAKWIDNETVSVQYNILPSIRSGKKIEIKDLVMNGVAVKVSALDYIEEDDHMEIEHREISTNGQFELVAYRYLKDRRNLNFIHVSIIRTDEEIPKYGNYLIADLQSDYIFDGSWTVNNELTLYSNSQYSDLIQYYLVENRPKIAYKIVIDDEKYGSKYRWTKKAAYNKTYE